MEVVVSPTEPLVNHANGGSGVSFLDGYGSIQTCDDYRLNIVSVFHHLSADIGQSKVTHADTVAKVSSTGTATLTQKNLTDIPLVQNSTLTACTTQSDTITTCGDINKIEISSDCKIKPLDARPKTWHATKLHDVSPETSSLTKDRLGDPTGGSNTKRKKLRTKSKSNKKWRTVNPSELGFDLSLLNSLQCNDNNIDNELGSAIQWNEDDDAPTVTSATRTVQCQVTSDVVLTGGNHNSSLAFDSDSDAAFFLSLGIDVYAEDADTDYDTPIDWDGTHCMISHSKYDWAAIKSTTTYTSNSCKTKRERSSKLTMKGAQRCTFQQRKQKKCMSGLKPLIESPENCLPAPPVTQTTYIKKSDIRYLYELECASSRKIYLRRDRHRRVEKAHRAVKSKNCKSILNNRGRKNLYMHHRLVKMHNLNFDFKNSPRPRTLPAMPKGHIDPTVAKSMFRADRNSEWATTPGRPQPVQNLRHTLHETNAPGHLDTDLASFLISLQHREMTPEDYEMLLRLDESVKPKTVSKTLLNSLKTDTVGHEGFIDDSDILCAICMEPYMAGDKRKFLPCEHHFHSNCIDTWLTNSSMNCPLDGLPLESS